MENKLPKELYHLVISKPDSCDSFCKYCNLENVTEDTLCEIQVASYMIHIIDTCKEAIEIMKTQVVNEIVNNVVKEINKY